jgi:WD40 repeat protein
MTYPDAGLYLFDASTHQSIGKRMTEQFPLIQILRFSADSKLLAAGSTDGSVRIWDVAERRLLGPALTCDGSVRAMEFRAGGKVLAWACAGGSVRMGRREVASAREPVFVGAAESAAFSPTCSTIASGQPTAPFVSGISERAITPRRSIATPQSLEAGVISRMADMP